MRKYFISEETTSLKISKRRNGITCRACANWDPDGKDISERLCWINNKIIKAEDPTCNFFTIGGYPAS